MIKVITSSNYTSWVHHGQIDPFEHFSKPSLTVPNMTMNLDELLRRYVRGEQVQLFEPQFSDADDIPDGIEHMTEQDRIDLARELKDNITTTRQRIQSRAAAAAALRDTAEPPVDSTTD